jgi:hypothetical protein
MAQHLTDAIVKRLPAPAKGNKVYYDSDLPGFGCRVTAADARSFVFNYRTKAGRERRITIGKATTRTNDSNVWRTTGAREQAKRLRRIVDQGGDPLGDIEDR